MTYASGMPWTDALHLSAKVAHHPVYTQALRQIINHIQEGHTLTQAFERTHLFPKIMIHMISVGETSGQLLDVLRHMSHHNADDVEQTLVALSNLLEPALMSIIGIMVGALLLAMYLPLLQLGALIST